VQFRHGFRPVLVRDFPDSLPPATLVDGLRDLIRDFPDELVPTTVVGL
jgi:hypothetical protein